MPAWNDIVGTQTPPAERVEHELRYRLAAPLVREAGLWIDLGCGAGRWAAAAFDSQPPDGDVLLVDRDEGAAQEAARAIGSRKAQVLAADLDTPEGLAQVSGAVAAGSDSSIVVTCFETLARVTAFAGLIELLVELRERHDATVLLSVPNDAFGGTPSGPNVWGVGAFEELRRLLPADAVVSHQVMLRASAVVAADTAASVTVGDVTIAAERVPSSLIAAFGPRAAEFGTGALAADADLDAERRRIRDRESDVVVLEAQAIALQDQLTEAQARITELERAGAPAVGA